MHLDGARVFNAAVALGIPVAELTAKADTVMFCLSKGLGAPVGSLLVGSAELMDRGRIYRKALGGGMRQAGILAAAGLIALEQGPQKLAQDHANAKFLAEGLAKIPGIKIDPAKVQTNILICDVSGTGLTSSDLSRKLAGSQVLANGVGPQLIRFVTHLDVSREQCARGAGSHRLDLPALSAWTSDALRLSQAKGLGDTATHSETAIPPVFRIVLPKTES